MAIKLISNDTNQALERLSRKVVVDWVVVRKAVKESFKEGRDMMINSTVANTGLGKRQAARRYRLHVAKRPRPGTAWIKISTSERAVKVHAGRLRNLKQMKRAVRAGKETFRNAFIMKGTGEKRWVAQRKPGSRELQGATMRHNLTESYAKWGKWILKRAALKAYRRARP